MKNVSSFFSLLWKGQRENEIQMSSWLDLRWEIKRENWGQFTWMCIEVSSHFVHDYPATDRPNVSKLSAKLWFSPRRHLLCPPRSHFQTSKKVTAKPQILFPGWQYIVWMELRHQQFWPPFSDILLRTLLSFKQSLLLFIISFCIIDISMVNFLHFIFFLYFQGWYCEYYFPIFSSFWYYRYFLYAKECRAWARIVGAKRPPIYVESTKMQNLISSLSSWAYLPRKQKT